MTEVLQKQYCPVFNDTTDINVSESNEVDSQHKLADMTFTASDIITEINFLLVF